MKNVKISLLTLSVGTSLALAAFAGTKAKTTAPPPNGTNYVLNVTVTNNPAPVVAVISGTPNFTDFGSNGNYGVVYTDGSGKFDGVEDMIFTNLDMCEFTSGDFITQIGGSIATVGGTKKTPASTVVQMTFKGNGYVQDSLGSTQGAANLNLTFKGTLFPSNSLVNLTTTNTFLEIGTNNGETKGFTNIYTYSPLTNIDNDVSGAYQSVYIVYQYESSQTSSNSTAGTNTTLIQNQLCQDYCYVNFGVPTGTTNTQTFFTSCAYCLTNNPYTNLVVIGTNFHYTTYGTLSTNINTTNFTYIYGLNISNLAGYISAVSNCITTNGTGYVQSIVAVLTNTVAASTNGSTNITLYAQLFPSFYNGTNWIFDTNNVNLTFSNGFFEVDGTLKGQITAGRCKQSFNGTNATFMQSFTDYTTMTGSGANTNGPYFGTNEPYLATNDSGIFYVVYEPVVNNNGLQVSSAFNGNFRATVKQWANNIFMSASGGFIGSGTQNPKKGSYKVGLKGVGRLSGSSLVLTGATGIDIVGYTVDTNIVAFTNTAAVPPVVGFVTNSTSSTNSDTFLVPLQFIAGVAVGDSYYDYFTLTTNGAGTANITVTNIAICSRVNIPPLVVTNTVNCIKSVFGNGKVLGQAVSGSGTNVDIPYAEPALH